MKVLVADGSATMRRIALNLLKELGCEAIEEAEDGAIALAMLMGARFDLVVCDLNMPNMGGLELLGAMRAEPALARIPVVVLAAEAKRRDIVSAAQAGAKGYLVKPFTKAALEEKLTKLLATQAA